VTILTFFLVSSKTVIFRTSMSFLHDKNLFFIYFPRDATLWELSNHGLFLQSCMVVVANTHETHQFLPQIKYAPLCPLRLIHKWTKNNAKKAYTKQSILLALLNAVGRSPENIQHLSHDNNLTSSSLKRGADVTFVKPRNCNYISTRSDEIIIHHKVPVSSSGQ